MVKQGPCRHCGVTSTPLWRNGPPEKPVLCNACGSRWRTKGNLTNYTPLHSRAETDELEDYKASRVRTVNGSRNKEVKAPKRKNSRNIDVAGDDLYDYNYSLRKYVDDDSSYRSSSGSGVSNSDSYGPFSSTVGSDLTGPEQSIVWDTSVPSRKRTCVSRSKPSPIEKFTQELYSIWQEQQYNFPEAPEEELLYESDTLMVSVEIGHGSVLIRHPNEIAHGEDSEASSISADAKSSSGNETHLRPATLYVHNEDKGAHFQAPRTEKSEQHSGQLMMCQEQSNRNELSRILEIKNLLGSHNSPLCAINLKDIVNLEEFSTHFTTQEQQQLLKSLPLLDVASYPVSLKNLFEGPQFAESISSFQQLLAEGVFDLSFPHVEAEDCRNLRRLALSNSSKSKWIEKYNLLKAPKSVKSTMKPCVTGSNVLKLSPLPPKVPISESKLLPKNLNTSMKSSNQIKVLADTKITSSNPNSIFAVPPKTSSSLLTNDSDQDLLLDVPSNNAFPQAELLHPNPSFMNTLAHPNFSLLR